MLPDHHPGQGAVNAITDLEPFPDTLFVLRYPVRKMAPIESLNDCVWELLEHAARILPGGIGVYSSAARGWRRPRVNVSLLVW